MNELSGKFPLPVRFLHFRRFRDIMLLYAVPHGWHKDFILDKIMHI